MAIPLRDNHTEEGTGEIVIDELVERPNRNQKKKAFISRPLASVGGRNKCPQHCDSYCASFRDMRKNCSGALVHGERAVVFWLILIWRNLLHEPQLRSDYNDKNMDHDFCQKFAIKISANYCIRKPSNPARNKNTISKNAAST